MCGIAGIVSEKNVSGAGEAIKRMTDAMKHRGPDGEGFYRSSNGCCLLGHRRLAIIDLSENAAQPMSNEDGSLQLVFNGEIYNFKELRKELESYGHRFHSNSDSETILHGYEQWREKCVERLRGMFAFAIWDEREERLFIARDRFGVKPLYYHQKDGMFIFASEVRALLASGFVPRKLDKEGVIGFLNFGACPDTLTLIDGIRLLKPAHYLVVKDGEIIENKEYWQIPLQWTNDISSSEALESVKELLRESIRLRLISDVPLGIFLSGGVDSSTIAVIAAKLGQRIKTLSIVFKEENFNEQRYSSAVAKQINSEHTEILLTAEDFQHLWRASLDSMDLPTADGINTWFVSKAAKDAGLTVALAGVGGDDVFWGYIPYKRVRRHVQILKTLSFLRPVLRQISFLHPKDKFPALFLSGDASTRYYLAERGCIIDRMLQSVVTEDFLKSSDFDPLKYLVSLIPYESHPLPLEIHQMFELRVYMHNQLLRDIDFMGMSHSLEIREPLLDHRLIEYVLSLPVETRIGKRQKWLLVDAAENIPKECVERPKMGFTFPFAIWFRKHLLSDVKAMFFSAPKEIFSQNGLERLWQRFVNGKIHWSRVWAICAFSYWLDKNRITV
ncbi:MAG: asparagine synthase (glutamine-hydrolyzing) [Planctomycetota bacterium]|nr:asparagine synthase (glutamine-hydrolyzing) [Planctomycetota bacterium]